MRQNQACECNFHCGCTSGDYVGCIKSVPIFSNLSKDEMQEISHITDAVTFKKGEMVYMAGDEGGMLYVLHTGRIKISRISYGGKEQVIRVISPGDFIGELSLLRARPHTDNAQAIETSTMCVIEGDKLKKLMEKYTSIAFKVMVELSRRLEKAENLIEVINLNSAEQRLAQILISLSGGEDEIVLNMKKGDLASHMGMTQETLSRKLALFQDEGLIKLIGHKKIVILDRDGLEGIVLA